MARPPKSAAPPDVERHDEVYFRHPSGPQVGKVLARGEQGVTLEHGGKRHRVGYQDLLGHKVRVRPDAKIVDHGEDGFIAEHPDGSRRFIRDQGGADEGEGAVSCAPRLAKSRLLVLGGAALLKSLKNRSGLTLQDTTDKAGHQTKRWRKIGAEAPAAERRGKAEPAKVARRKSGEQVSFKTADGSEGEGEVVGQPGAAGAHVRTPDGREVRVRWGEMSKAPTKAAGGDAPSAAKSDAGPKPFYDPKHVAGLAEKAAQPHDTFEALSREGKVGLEQFKDALGAVGEKLGLRTDLTPEQLRGHELENGDGFLFVAPLKSEKRSREKVEADYDGDWSQLRDVIRGTIAVSSVAQLHKAVAAVQEAGLHLAQQPKDRFAKPTAAGYRDLLTIVKLPNGMLAELQFHLKPITAAKERGHHDYEVERGLQAKYREDSPSEKWSEDDHSSFYRARRAQKELYDGAWKAAQARG